MFNSLKKDVKVLKTKSIRARIDDAKILEQISRELAVELQRQVPVSELVNELMEYKDDAKETIKKREKNMLKSTIPSLTKSTEPTTSSF